MFVTKKINNRREAFTLVEMIVVIGIILVIAALAAAFAPRVSDSNNMTRAVDNLEQWLLSAKMRAKRDNLATGIRFIQAPGDPAGVYSQVQYIQQPDPLCGVPGGATLNLAGVDTQGNSLPGVVSFSNIDFSLGGAVLAQPLVQPGDYLEIRDGGVYSIAAVPGNTTLLIGSPSQSGYYSIAGNFGGTTYYMSSYDNALVINTSTGNFRILRQPRILIGEDPLSFPNNYAVNFNTIPTTTSAGSNVMAGPSGVPEILFSPTGAVIGTNAGSGKLLISVYDQTMNPFDINRVGIVGVQTRTGFIGAYSAAAGADPFYYAEIGKESGL